MRNREERAKAFIATMLTVAFCMFAGAKASCGIASVAGSDHTDWKGKGARA